MADDTKRLPVTKPSVPATSEAWSPLERMRDEIDRLFDSFSLFDLRFPQRRPVLVSAYKAASTWELAPAMNVVEKADSYEITAELPGLSENDIEVKLSNHSLVIKGEKSEEEKDQGTDYYLSERRFGSFRRNFQLPEDIDAPKVAATFSKGILTVKLPKTAKAKTAEKTIAIKAA